MYNFLLVLTRYVKAWMAYRSVGIRTDRKALWAEVKSGCIMTTDSLRIQAIIQPLQRKVARELLDQHGLPYTTAAGTVGFAYLVLIGRPPVTPQLANVLRPSGEWTLGQLASCMLATLLVEEVITPDQYRESIDAAACKDVEVRCAIHAAGVKVPKVRSVWLDAAERFMTSGDVKEAQLLVLRKCWPTK